MIDMTEMITNGHEKPPAFDRKDAKAAALLGLVTVGMVVTGNFLQDEWTDHFSKTPNSTAVHAAAPILELSPYQLDAPVQIVSRVPALDFDTQHACPR